MPQPASGWLAALPPHTLYNTLALDSLTYLLGVSSILVASRSLYFTSYYMADSAKEKRKKRKEKAATTEKPPAQQPADGDGKPANVDGESEITPPSTSHRSKSRPTSPRSKNARRDCTDHKSLTSSFRGLSKQACDRITRWVQKTCCFNMDLYYLLGCDMHLPDLLSRCKDAPEDAWKSMDVIDSVDFDYAPLLAMEPANFSA